MARRLTPIDVDVVKARLAEGISLHVIASEHGCNSTTLKRRCRALGLDIPDQRKLGGHLPTGPALIAELRQASPRDLAERYGTTPKAVWNAVHRARAHADASGIRRSVRHDRRLPETAVLVAELRDGETAITLAARYGVTKAAIRSALRIDSFVIQGDRVFIDGSVGRTSLTELQRMRQASVIEKRAREIQTSKMGAAA